MVENELIRVPTSVWKDCENEEFTPQEVYIYLYLLTNSCAVNSVPYVIPLCKMSHETGYNERTLRTLLLNLENDLGVIRYNVKEQDNVPVVEMTAIKDMCGGQTDV